MGHPVLILYSLWLKVHLMVLLPPPAATAPFEMAFLTAKLRAEAEPITLRGSTSFSPTIACKEMESHSSKLRTSQMSI